MIKKYTTTVLLATSVLALAFLLSACASAPAEVAPAAAAEGEQSQAAEEPQLATAKVISQLSNQAGRAIVSARGNHFIVDSVPPLEGPNEELNPLDMILSALATCGIFIAEKVAVEEDIPLEGATATVEGDFNPSGVASGEVDPRIQAFRVYLALPGADAEQAAALVENFTRRCPIYTTLILSAPIDIITDGEATSEPIEGLATASVSAELSNQPGRAIVSARGNHFVIDSVPPLEGPNEERNPLDLMLGALATCGTFIYERVAQEQQLPLTAITVAVEGDFDPRGVSGEAVNPRMQAFRVHMQLAGVDEAQAEQMQAEFEARCPIYTTLSRTAPIEITAELAE